MPFLVDPPQSARNPFGEIDSPVSRERQCYRESKILDQRRKEGRDAHSRWGSGSRPWSRSPTVGPPERPAQKRHLKPPSTQGGQRRGARVSSSPLVVYLSS